MSKDSKLKPVDIYILGKNYTVACFEYEQETLLLSAHKLDEQMREIRNAVKINSTDKIAVMAALNLTHELHQTQNTELMTEQNISDRLAKLRHKIENILATD